ncbi:MAG: porin family protein [Gemmatimonadales bacterium]|nr:MAG: porin family protein [Gemmatimonadales bacterium]
MKTYFRESVTKLAKTLPVPILVLALGVMGSPPAEAEAQLGIAVEGRAGVTFPQGDLLDAGAESGFHTGGEVQVNLNSKLTAYLGVNRYAFNCDNGCGALGDNPRSTGLGAGLKYIIYNPGDVLAWGRGGIVANTFGSDSGSGDREIGFELGVGADLPVADRLYIVPNIGFVQHDSGRSALDRASFFTLGLGVHYHVR